MPLHPPPPKVLALLVAQYIHQDPRTGLYSLHDVFDAIATPALPVAQPLGVFLQLTELHGATTPLRLRLVDADEARPPLFEQSLLVPGGDPLAVTSISYRGTAFLAVAGSYRLQLLVGDDLLFERLLEVKMLGVRNATA